ncbi:MAG: zinc-ribbon domain-containing protein [Candidatus Rokubacteria bacterium]|nr:zinc-ribbon domain-containing protein [Candidatus Rokubacteria bacterium]
MKCPRCERENEAGAKFCEECAAPLARTCGNCGRQLSPTARFCPECAHPTGLTPAAPTAPRFASPESYTPKHLAERILMSKGAVEGERKQVTVLFADLKGSMELLSDRDPEEARKILDPVLELMMEAVHRYEGTVNQVMGDGIMALFGAPLACEDHAVRACYAALRMQERVKRYAESVRRAEGLPLQIRVGLNSGDVVVRGRARAGGSCRILSTRSGLPPDAPGRVCRGAAHRRAPRRGSSVRSPSLGGRPRARRQSFRGMVALPPG